MTEIVDARPSALTRPSSTAKALALPLALSVVTIAVVLSVLAGSHSATRSVAIPFFLAGACISFGVGIHDLARTRDDLYARVLIGAAVLWSFSALAASSMPFDSRPRSLRGCRFATTTTRRPTSSSGA